MNQKISNSANNYFIRIHRKLYEQIRVLLSRRHYLVPKYTAIESQFHVKVTIASLGFVAYKFRNRNVKWWLNVSTW